MKTNKNKKVTKPEFIVDMTTAETPLDVAYEFAEAKVRAGKPITQNEADTIEKTGFMTAANVVDACIADAEKHTTFIEDDKLAEDMIKLIKKHQNKKLPWYKRFWRWITFRKNK
jgi:hypothetical protein